MITRPNMVYLNPDAVAENLSLLRKLLPRGTEIWQVCKGDGYGLGVVQAAQLGVDAGVRKVCVGTPEEALTLRLAFPNIGILLFPSANPKAFPTLAAQSITLTVHNQMTLETVLDELPDAVFELKVNTGLHRFGFDKGNWIDTLDQIAAKGHGGLQGIYSHISQSRDDQGIAAAISDYQWFLDTARQRLGWTIPSMAAASPTVLKQPDLPFDRIDPGRALYGMLTGDDAGGHILCPVVASITSQLLDSRNIADGETAQIGYGGTNLRPVTRVGTFPIGHFDGLPATGPLGSVYVRGHEVPVLARTLLSSILDLTDVPDAQDGDEVVLVGKSGALKRDIFDFASSLGTSATMLHFNFVRNLPKEIGPSAKRRNSAEGLNKGGRVELG